jgi:hypothetical protein
MMWQARLREQLSGAAARLREQLSGAPATVLPSWMRSVQASPNHPAIAYRG